MTIAQLREAVEGALGTVPFTAPTLEYCAAVKKAMKSGRAGILTEVYLRGRELVVEARYDQTVHTMVIPL